MAENQQTGEPRRALALRVAGYLGGSVAERICSCFLLLMLLGFPLVSQSGFSNITSAKFYFFTISLAVFALLMLVVLLRKQWRIGLRRPTAVSWLLMALLLLSCLSAVLSPYGAETLLGKVGYWGLLLQAAMIICTLLLAAGGSWHKLILPLIALAVLANSLVSMLQLLGYNPLGMYPAGYNYYDGGVRYVGQFLGLIGNIDMLSGYFCLSLPLMLYAFVQQKTPLRWLYAAALLGGLATALWMQVDSGLLALLATAVVFLLLALRGKKRLLLFLLLLLLAVAGLLWLYNYQGAEQGILWEMSRILHGEIKDSFGSSRVQIWRQAADAVADAPWLGSGPGTRSTRFDISYSRLVEETGRTLTARVNNSHSEYLDYALEIGLPGVAVYLAALLLSLVQAVRRGQKDRLALALAASVFCYAVQALFNSAVVVLAPMFWLHLGMLLFVTKPKQGEKVNED